MGVLSDISQVTVNDYSRGMFDLNIFISLLRKPILRCLSARERHCFPHKILIHRLSHAAELKPLSVLS
jgi:hypothetical protein